MILMILVLAFLIAIVFIAWAAYEMPSQAPEDFLMRVAGC
jgi:hypothetical protein